MARALTDEEVYSIFDTEDEYFETPEQIRRNVETDSMRKHRLLMDKYGTIETEEPNPVSGDRDYKGKYIDMRTGEEVGAPDNFPIGIDKAMNKYLFNPLYGHEPRNDYQYGNYENSHIVLIPDDPDAPVPDVGNEMADDMFADILANQEASQQTSPEVSDVPRGTIPAPVPVREL